MEEPELLEDKAGQSHGRVVRKWQPRNSCMTSQSSNRLFVLCTTTTALCTTATSQLVDGSATATRRDRTSIPPHPRWSQHLTCTADGVIHMGLILAGDTGDNKMHLRSLGVLNMSINCTQWDLGGLNRRQEKACKGYLEVCAQLVSISGIYEEKRMHREAVK